jgi:hydrogenase maturation factor
MLKLVRYTIIWVSQNLSIPFWMVGHVHLSVNIYDDIYEILASMGMNILVAVGFVLSYIDEQKK